MSMQDPLADMFTVIRNAQMVFHPEVSVAASSLKIAICEVLQQEGYIARHSVEEKDGGKRVLHIHLRYHQGRPVIQEIKRISRPGLRQYVPYDALPQVHNGLGVAIVSTSRGLMTDRAARRAHCGGEVLCTVF